MADKSDPTRDEGPGAFFEATLGFVTRVTEAAVKACGNDPDADLVRANGAVVTGNFQRLFERAQTAYAGSNPAIRAAVSEALAVADGVSMAAAGESAATASLTRRVFGGGFFSWVSKHLTEIKKLIRIIVEMIFGKVPVWLDTLLTLIDEFWNMIWELVAGVFGQNRRDVAKDLSSGEVNALNEIAATQRLRAASLELSKADED